MDTTPEYCCTECEAEFKVVHDELNEPKFCPFCANELDLRDFEEEQEIEEE